MLVTRRGCPRPAFMQRSLMGRAYDTACKLVSICICFHSCSNGTRPQYYSFVSLICVVNKINRLVAKVPVPLSTERCGVISEFNSSHLVDPAAILSPWQPSCRAGWQPSCPAGSHLIMPAAILFRQQPSCHSGSHLVMLAAILLRWQPSCHAIGHLVVPSAILSLRRPSCYAARSLRSYLLFYKQTVPQMEHCHGNVSRVVLSLWRQLTEDQRQTMVTLASTESITPDDPGEGAALSDDLLGVHIQPICKQGRTGWVG